jgi:hypothetical protein
MGDGLECHAMLRMVQLTLAAGALVATILQFVGALCVRDYARTLWIKELRNEGCGVEAGDVRIPSKGEERRLSIILEEEEGKEKV